jgi:hypothetical protein
MFSLDALFCYVNDFCKAFETEWYKKLLNHGGIKPIYAKSLCLSEIMTILIAFHQNQYCNFKQFYLNCVKQQWCNAAILNLRINKGLTGMGQSRGKINLTRNHTPDE